MAHYSKRQKLDTFTVHVKCTLDGMVREVDANGEDTVSGVRERVAGLLEVDSDDIALLHEGEEVHDYGMTLCLTVWGEGTEVEARGSKQFEAKQTLRGMDLGWEDYDIVDITLSGEDDTTISRGLALMLVANPGVEPVEDVAEAMHECCSMGYPLTVKVFLERYGLIEAPGLYSFLHAAAGSGAIETAKILLSYGADVNRTCGDDVTEYSTALHEAASNGRLAMVKFLVEHGADVNKARAEVDPTAATLAAGEGHLDIMKYLLSAGANTPHTELLLHAAKGGHCNTIQHLLAAGARLNVGDDCAWTPLHFAAMEGHLEAVKVLISAGCDASLKDDNGWTPQALGRLNGYRIVVEYLATQKGGVPPDYEDEDFV